jgi:RNA polymerase sigma factor (sigma-70 family)
MKASAAPRGTPVPPDEALIAAVARGDLEAFGHLFERHEPALRRYLGRLGFGPSDADDLVQATFLELLRAAQRFDPRHAPTPWLYGIARMMARRQRRSLQRAAARFTEWTRLMLRDRAPTPAAVVEGDAAERRLAAALERLSPKKREVFVLVTLEGMSGEAAAAVLGVPVNTVWTRLHHARIELRRALEESEP